MAKVELKTSGNEAEKGKVITVNKKADYMAIKGTEKSTFNGVVKLVHKHLGEKLITGKKAVEAKGVDFDIKENDDRTVKEVK